MIIETHAHYDDLKFDEDRGDLLLSLSENNIKRVVNVGSSVASCKRTLELSRAYDFIYAAIGIHPTDTAELDEELFSSIEGMVLNRRPEDKVIAVGEIGLDYNSEEPSPEYQKDWFIRQLDLARRSQLPVIIHSRDAAKDTLDIMKAERAGEIGGVVHCFSYSLEMAREYLNMGFYIGVGGVVTFKNGRKLQEVVENIPLQSIVLETDCPYLSPVPLRGSRNSSINLKYVTEKIAQLKGITIEEVERVTWDNACRMYRIQV